MIDWRTFSWIIRKGNLAHPELYSSHWSDYTLLTNIFFYVRHHIGCIMEKRQTSVYQCVSLAVCPSVRPANTILWFISTTLTSLNTFNLLLPQWDVQINFKWRWDWFLQELMPLFDKSLIISNTVLLLQMHSCRFIRTRLQSIVSMLCIFLGNM